MNIFLSGYYSISISVENTKDERQRWHTIVFCELTSCVLACANATRRSSQPAPPSSQRRKAT